MGLFDRVRGFFGGIARIFRAPAAPAKPAKAPQKPPDRGKPAKPKAPKQTRKQQPSRSQKKADSRSREQKQRDAEAQRRRDDNAQREYQRKREAEERARQEREARAAKEAARRAEEQARREEQKRQEAEARKREKEAARRAREDAAAAEKERRKAEKETERELRRRQKAEERKRREEYRERRKKWRAEHDDRGLIDLTDDQIVNQRGNMDMLNTLIKKGYIEKFETKHEAAEFLRVLDSKMWAESYATLYSIVAFQELQDAIRRGLTARDLQDNYNIAAEKKSHSPLAVWEDFVSNFDPDRPGYSADDYVPEGHPLKQKEATTPDISDQEYQESMRDLLRGAGVTDEQMAKSAAFGHSSTADQKPKKQTRKQKKKRKKGR